MPGPSFQTETKCLDQWMGISKDNVSTIEYLIQEKILVVSSVQTQIDSENHEIPSWIKSRTGWCADRLVTDNEFLSGIEYMIERGILTV